MIKCLVFLPLLCIGHALLAQSHFEPGKIITDAGDTLKGYIDNQEWRKNPREIRFRQGKDDSPVKTLGLSDLRYFSFNEGGAYIRAIVVEDMSAAGEFLAPVKSTSTDTVYLKVLVLSAHLSLYQLVDSKEHFYISKEEGQYEELLNRNYLEQNRDGYTIQKEERIYKDQLTSFVQKGPDSLRQVRKIQNLEYAEGGLTSIIYSLNGASPATILNQSSSSTGIGIQFLAGAGLRATLMSFGSTSLSNLHFNPAFGPLLEVGIDFLSRRNRGDLTFRLEAIYWSADCKGAMNFASYKETYELKANALTTTVNLLYNFYRKDNFRAYIGAGIDLNFCDYPTHVYYGLDPSGYEAQPNYAVPNNFWLGMNLRTGVQINNRYGVEFQAHPIGTCLNSTTMTASLDGYSLKALYFF